MSLLQSYDDHDMPLDLCVHRYFVAHKALGSKDRAYVAETAYTLVRWRGLLDHVAEETSWPGRYHALQSGDLEAAKNDMTIPQHIRLSFPKVLFDLLVADHGLENAVAICQASNTQAPTTIRANTLKISREELLARLETRFPVSPCQHASTGITFQGRINFSSLPEFKEGLFEVQDEGSQLVAATVAAKPQQHVLDYCAGAGGKALAIAPSLQGTGQIYLHDIRIAALHQARERLRRAGITNVQICGPGSGNLRRLKGKMDWVLVDAPCTGTGTLRRNPDMKWKFSTELLSRLQNEQRNIFSEALSFLKPGGTIVYATCSILTEENQQQLDYFVKTHELHPRIAPFQSFPTPNGMDGFFSVPCGQ